jgi:thioredoxin 1
MMLMAGIALVLAERTSRGELRNGMTREELEAELGPPSGEMVLKGRLNLVYDGGIIEVVSNRVVGIDRHFRERAEQRRKERAFEAEQLAKGLVKVDGKWMTPEEAARIDAEKKARLAALQPRHGNVPAARPAAPYTGPGDVQEIRGNGKRVELSEILVPGKVTVIDFFADWCGPCRTLSPMLEQMAATDGDVVVRKVDIVNWKSAVAAQYQLQSIPNVRVYNREGQQVGQPTHSIQQIAQYVAQAK